MSFQIQKEQTQEPKGRCPYHAVASVAPEPHSALTPSTVAIELDDLQSGILQPRPSPYAGKYLIYRIDDARDGREMLRRLSCSIASAASWSAKSNAWITVAFSCQGLKALGVSQDSLDSFPQEFREGMAARAELLGDVGGNAPSNWEAPLGTPDVHIAIAAIAPDRERLEAVLKQARDCSRDLTGISVIWQQDCYTLPTEREAFGFRDGISHPAIEGSGIAGSNPQEEQLKAGEFILGYTDETGSLPKMPSPDVLGRNGTFVVFRKLYQDVAGFRRYLRANAANADEEELLAAKFVGRWRSGCPLSLSPEHDDPELGADPTRNNDEVRAFIQSGQVTAVGLFRAIPELTLAQVRKGQRIQKAFEQVLDQPGAEELLEQPALKPLLDEAAD